MINSCRGFFVKRLIFTKDTSFLINRLFSPLYRIYLPEESSQIKFQISRLLISCSGFCIRHSDWLNVTDFYYYKLKIKLISRLIKRGDQSLISISTILKISALKNLPHFSEQRKIFLDSVYNLLNVKSFILFAHPTSI